MSNTQAESHRTREPVRTPILALPTRISPPCFATAAGPSPISGTSPNKPKILLLPARPCYQPRTASNGKRAGMPPTKHTPRVLEHGAAYEVQIHVVQVPTCTTYCSDFLPVKSPARRTRDAHACVARCVVTLRWPRSQWRRPT